MSDDANRDDAPRDDAPRDDAPGDDAPGDDRPQRIAARSDRSDDDRTTGVWRIGRTAWAVLGILGVFALTAWVAGRLSLIVVPLVLALFPATLLVPVAARLRAWGWRASLAALAVLLLALAMIGGLIWGMVMLVIDEGPQLVESASSGVQEIERWIARDPLGVGIEGSSDLLAAAREQLGEFGDYAGQAATAATAATEVVTGMLLLFVVLFFYLKDGRRLVRGILSVFPMSHRLQLARSADLAWDALASYFRGQLTVALVDAVFIGIGLWILGVPLAVPLAVLIFFGALFPLIGALVTGGLAVLVSLADGGLVSALIVLALIVAVQQVEGNVLQPLILGRATALHPMVVILAITAGAVLFGVLGAFLAVPTTAIVARIVEDHRQERSAPSSGAAPAS